MKYESKDIDFYNIVKLTVLLLVILGTIHLLGHFLDHFFLRRSLSKKPPASAAAGLDRLPPEPRLQVNPPLDLIRLRDVEDVRLNNYTWLNPDTGKTRIPIARAMVIVAERRSYE
jgi:hypothetical protein